MCLRIATRSRQFLYEPGDEMRQVLKEIVPENPNQPYDMKEVIAGIVDEDTFHEVHKDFAENMIVGFAFGR